MTVTAAPGRGWSITSQSVGRSRQRSRQPALQVESLRSACAVSTTASLKVQRRYATTSDGHNMTVEIAPPAEHVQEVLADADGNPCGKVVISSEPARFG